MSELFDQIVSMRGSFENLLARIPGFRGYIDKATRRTADRTLRDHIASELTARINRLSALEVELLENGGLSHMSATRSVKEKLQTFRDRVKAAAPGYSGFMEAIKVDADALEQLYAFDEAQIRYAAQIDELLNNLETAIRSGDGLAEALRALDDLAREANEAFSLREDVLTNLSKSLE
jgi:ABC-type transporter Mla subunit MlaD